MKVKIIQPVPIDTVKEGKIYEVIKENRKGFIIKDDKGLKRQVYYREIKIVKEIQT